MEVGGGVGGGDRDVCFSDTHGNVKGTERHKSFKSWGQICRGILGICFAARSLETSRIKSDESGLM